MNQFVIPDDGRREKPQTRQFVQRGDFGASALFVFSPDWSEIITLYGSRFDNRKVPSGGIEERDFPKPTASIRSAAKCAAIRELQEEVHISEDDLHPVAETSIEDTIRGDMKRYYFVAMAKQRTVITQFRSQEDGKEHYVDRQRWESVENVLRGASRDGETYNTLYAIALVRVLQEMKERGFKEDVDFSNMLIGLAFSGIHLDEQLVLLEERKAREEDERKQRRLRY